MGNSFVVVRKIDDPTATDATDASWKSNENNKHNFGVDLFLFVFFTHQCVQCQQAICKEIER